MTKEEIFEKHEKLDNYVLTARAFLTGPTRDLEVEHEYIVTWHLNNRNIISHKITKEEYEVLLRELENGQKEKQL